MIHTILFLCPDAAYGISRVFASGEASARAQVRHLEGLGYTVVDVVPALDGQYALQLSQPQVPAQP